MTPRIGHRELLSLHQDRLDQHQANLNELTTNALRNPLRENLNANGHDIKNVRKITTSNSLKVGTSVTVGNSITSNGDIAVGGNITNLNGDILLPNGGSGGGGGGGGNGISSIKEDHSPQLGGPLDVNEKDIISSSNGDIDLDPDGTGVVVFKGNIAKGAGQFKLNCENNSHGITIKGPPHSAEASYILTLPHNTGIAGQVLKTDGYGALSWVNQSSGGGSGGGGGTGTLLDNYPDSHIVKNGIGDIASQTTVANLRQYNNDLTDIVAEMLKIERADVIAPIVSGALLTITTLNADVKFGAPYPPSISIRFDRGIWTNAFQSDGTPATTLPHNPGDLVVLDTGFGFDGTNLISNIKTSDITNSDPNFVEYSEDVIQDNFNVWGNITLNASMTTSSISTGEVYDNHRDITTTTPTSQTFTRAKTWSVYKPVYVNQDEIEKSLQPGSGAGSNPSLPGTVKVFSYTSDVIIIDHRWDHDIYVPAKTTTQYPNVYQYNTLTRAWYNINFTAAPVPNYKEYGDYWKITLNIALRDDADVKISI